MKGVNLGLTVTKAQAPTDPPASKIIKPGKDKGTGTVAMASSLGKTSVYAKSLAQHGKKEKGDNIPEFEPPKLIKLERKLQILLGEWFQESFYKNEDVAALYAFYQPT